MLAPAQMQPPPLPPVPAARRRAPVGGIVAVALLVALTAGLLLAAAATLPGIPLGGRGATDHEPAGLIVNATDGSDVALWIERDGQPGRAMPRECEVAPGPVALRVTRRVGEDRYQSDIVRMTLRAGCRHLVAVGDGGMSAYAYQRSSRRETASRFPAPGVLCFDPQAGLLKTVAGNAAGPADAPALGTWHPLYFGEPAAVEITAGDRALLICNPYPEVIDCRLNADGWDRELSVDGPVCRVVGIGNAQSLRVRCRWTGDNAPVEDRTINPGEGLCLYTIGGRTAYRWTAPASGDSPAPARAAPPIPRGWMTTLPTGCSVRLSADPPAERRVLTLVQWHGVDLGLTPLLSNLPPRTQPGPSAPVSVQREFRLMQLRVPGGSPAAAIDAVATDGSSVVAVIDGVACDLSTAKPLHAATDSPVVAAAWGRRGLVLLTADGELARVRDRRLAPIKTIDDPTMQLMPSTADEPSVLLFGGTLIDQIRIEPLRAAPGPLYPLPGVTALTAVDGGMLIARGRRIDRAAPAAPDDPRWALQPVLALPDANGDPIISVAVVGGRLFLSTRDSVSTLQDDLVLPVVSGIGGRILAFRDGLLIHDAASHRLFELLPADASGRGVVRP